MQFFATIATLFSLASVATADWALYCGDTCGTNTTLIASGNLTSLNPTCTSMSETYEYCYFEASKYYFKALVLEGEDCIITDDDVETVLRNGSCTDSGSWNSYLTALSL